ncbi:hypothetical protein AO262_21095 [Pseudomonas fluorescens ABAC62]|nr:hypothetical protein AO262_21095 [Pseudomonas fluorescens ABAC62]
MSEMKRYHVQLYKLAEDQQKYAHGALGAVEIVRASDFDRVTAERDALQQRLTAADERADLLEGLLRELIDADSVLAQWTSNEVADDAENAYQNAFEKLKAALKPAEGGGDE